MQEQMNAAMASLSATVGEDVPTFNEIRDKIEARHAKARGMSELQGQSVEGRMLEVEQASQNTQAQARLAQLKSELGLGGTTAPASGPDLAKPAEAPSSQPQPGSRRPEPPPPTGPAPAGHPGGRARRGRPRPPGGRPLPRPGGRRRRRRPDVGRRPVRPHRRRAGGPAGTGRACGPACASLLDVPVVLAAAVAGDVVVTLERADGRDQATLVVARADGARLRPSGARRPPCRRGRRHRRHRLVPPLPRRHPRRLRHLDRRRRALDAAGRRGGRRRAGSPTPSPARGPPRWRGGPTPPASSTPATRTRPRCRGRGRLPPHRVRARPRRRPRPTTRSCRDDLPDPTAWAEVAPVPRRPLAPRRTPRSAGTAPTSTCYDRTTGAWTTVVEGVDALTDLRVVGDRLVGTTTLDAPTGPGRSAAPLDRPDARPAGRTCSPPPTPSSRAGRHRRRRCSWRRTRSAVVASCVHLAPAHRAAGGPQPDRPRRAARAGVARRARQSPTRDEAAVVAHLLRPAAVAASAGRARGRAASPCGDPADRPVDAGRLRRRAGCATRRPTAPRSRCSSCAGPTSRRRRRRPTSSPATAASRITMSPAYSPDAVAVADGGGRVRRRLHPRRRRGGRGLAPGRHARASKQQVLRRLRRRPPTGSSPRAAPRATAWPSGAAATAGCSWPPRSPSGPTCAAAVAVARCRCSTWCASTASCIARLWIPEYGDPDGADEFAWLLRVLAVPPRRRRHLLPRRAAHHRRGGQPGRPAPRPQDGGPARRRPPLRRRRARAAAGRARAGHGQGKPVVASRPTSPPTSSPSSAP